MGLLPFINDTEFNTQQEEWVNLVKAELKLDDLGAKATKSTLDGGCWPVLSLSYEKAVHLPCSSSWKKASQTYVRVEESGINEVLESDFNAGVRTFFFEKDFLTENILEKVFRCLKKLDQKNECDVFLLGTKEINSSITFERVIDENKMAIGRTSHDHGGTIVHELGLMAYCLIKKLQTPENQIFVGVFVDSQFFKNIAKIRAAKLIANKILEEARVKKKVVIIALSSMREWTLYERYSNMLRNDVAVASAYIAGSDYVQSSGYQTLFELEGLEMDKEHGERSARMARNTSHILALESHLGMVEDAAYGSYHLENLTESFAQGAWEFMQKIIPLSPVQPFIKEVCSKVAEERVKRVRFRKQILAGLNDFPDVNERLNLKLLPKPKIFRVARDFESLRIKIESMSRRPEVQVALFGDLAALNARINFVKNYFELLGLKVHEPKKSQNNIESFSEEIISCQKDIIVLCAQDTDYPLIQNISQQVTSAHKFLAGKFELSGFTNLFVGQNVYEILEKFLSDWEAK